MCLENFIVQKCTLGAFFQCWIDSPCALYCTICNIFQNLTFLTLVTFTGSGSWGRVIKSHAKDVFLLYTNWQLNFPSTLLFHIACGVSDFLNPVNLTKSWRFLVRDGKNKKMSKNALWGRFFNVGSILHAFQTICNIFQNLTFLTLVTPKRVQGQTEVI